MIRISEEKQAIKKKRFRFSVHFPRLHTLFPTLPNNIFSNEHNRDFVVAVDYCNAKLSQSHTAIQIFMAHGTILPRSASKWRDSAKLQFGSLRIQIFGTHRITLPGIAQKWRGFGRKKIPTLHAVTWWAGRYVCNLRIELYCQMLKNSISIYSVE